MEVLVITAGMFGEVTQVGHVGRSVSTITGLSLLYKQTCCVLVEHRYCQDREQIGYVPSIHTQGARKCSAEWAVVGARRGPVGGGKIRDTDESVRGVNAVAYDTYTVTVR